MKLFSRRNMVTAVLLPVILGCSVVANAASISLADSVVDVQVGDVFTIDLLGDFTGDPTAGGGLDLFYDETVLAFESFSFGSTTFDLDPAFSRMPDHMSGKLGGIAFGQFNGLDTAGTVGTFSFRAIAEGASLLEMSVTDNHLVGGFYSIVTYSEQTVTFDTASVNVSSVPVPAAVWLFGSGLVGLAGIARRKQ